MKPLPANTRQARRGFTVTELLVVIVIVAVLAALSFPVVTKVRNRAKSMKCLAQMREWSNVIARANTDLGGGLMHCPNNYASFGSSTPSPFAAYWAEAAGLSGDSDRTSSDYTREEWGRIAKVVGLKRHCICWGDDDDLDYSGNPPTSYSVNTYLQAAGTGDQEVLRINDFRRLSKKIYFMDTRLGGALNFRTAGRGGMVSGVREAEPSHGGKVSALFLDMHIEQMDADQLDNDWRLYTQPTD